MSTPTRNQNPRGFEIRKIVSGQRIDVSGYALEIMRSGPRGAGDVVVFGKASVGTMQAYDEDSQLRAIPGKKAIADFDFIELLPRPNAAYAQSDISYVVVKVHARKEAAFVNTEPTGKARTTWLSRGHGDMVVATNGVLLLYEDGDFNFPQVEEERYWTDGEREDVRQYWTGWVWSSGSFRIWVLANNMETQDGTGPTWNIVQRFDSRNFTAAAPAGITSASIQNRIGSSVDFTCGIASEFNNGTGSGARLAMPAGNLRVYFENTIAASSGTHVEWQIGAVGHA